jgi:mutator protein MutT
MTHIIEAPPPICTVAEPNLGAAAAIIVSRDRRFLLQHRDAKLGIWFPDSWSLFGGSIEPGETPGQAVRRELIEEIGFAPREIRYFTQVAWDFARWGLGVKLRYIFEVAITAEESEGLVLQEGQAMRLFSADEILREPRLAPYDGHALRMYIEEPPIGLGRREP